MRHGPADALDGAGAVLRGHHLARHEAVRLDEDLAGVPEPAPGVRAQGAPLLRPMAALHRAPPVEDRLDLALVVLDIERRQHRGKGRLLGRCPALVHVRTGAGAVVVHAVRLPGGAQPGLDAATAAPAAAAAGPAGPGRAAPR